MWGKKDTRDQDSVDLYVQGFFSQVPKDWKVSLKVVGDGFFHFPKKHGWEGLLTARTSIDIAGQPVQPRRPTCGSASGVFDLDRPGGRRI